ncbi:MAG: hypothetical protein ABI810_08840 [Sphingomonas bacterium]
MRYLVRSHHRRQQGRTLLAYAALLAVAIAPVACGLEDHAQKAILLGMTFPGAGFLGWSSGQELLAAGLFGAGLGVFGLSLILWFATGNVVAPLLVWGALAALAGMPATTGLETTPLAGWPWLIGPAVLTMAALAWLWSGIRVPKSRSRETCSIAMAAALQPVPDEASLDELQRMRLLLDRALQPVDRFDGFEWRDQFQTGAMRYQVNFMSYALAMAQHRHAPAATGCFADAQHRLMVKIGDSRLWRYWALENAWGNLRLGGDPVPRQNIMYSGFTALQMALGGGERLELHRGGEPWRGYDLGEMTEALSQQYRASRHGLLACEPNWIYPLCNLITMAGIRAGDAQLGTDRWRELSGPFLASLAREATRSDGSFIAFRSSLTGIAPPAPGGIVMQAFPCLFLNALSPELAQEHWHRVRRWLDNGSWSRLFWPVDVGNYGFSRASSYAATAAAAVEMGDAAIAAECLGRLEEECPSREIGGVVHRENASLWAHALEMLVRSSQANGLRDLVERPSSGSGPRLVSAPYPDILVARAVAEGRNLELVLHPGGASSASAIEIGGLMPERHYHTGLPDQRFLKADRDGCALLPVSLTGRTALSIKPVV